MRQFQGKNVAILGWAVDVQDVAPWLEAQGATLTILDEKKDPEAFSDLTSYDVIVRSPGVYRYRKELIDAEKAGAEITSKTKIFFDLCPAKIIGVTGTKGKGTTSTLIYEILKAAGKDVYLGGNMGKGVFEFLPKLTKDSWVVLELSSFQLIDLQKSPHIAVVLMVTSDHLDWHKDGEEYVNAKSSISKFQSSHDFVVYNAQYPNSVQIGLMGEGKKIAVRRSDWTKPVRLRGDHNRENLAAADAVAEVLQIDKNLRIQVIQNFKGLEHRLEEVAVVDGVTYFDDSISTTPETAIAAIDSFTEPMVLLLGGSDKGSDYSELGEKINAAKNVKAVVVIGLMAENIRHAILQSKNKRDVEIVEGGKTMKEIVQQTIRLAESGDVVVLSPACASFDMFQHYKDRGEQFRKAVLELQQ